MKTAKSYIVPVFLILAILVISVKALGIRKEVEEMSATIEAKQASLHQSPVSSKSQPADNEIIAARQIVEALAAKHGLPVETKVEGGLIHVRALPMQARIGSVTHRDTALGNYDGVLGLLSTLSGLPYSMSYRSFCAGTECPSQLDFSLEVKGLAK